MVGGGGGGGGFLLHSVRPVLGVAAYFITEPRFTSCCLRCLPLQEGGGERFFSGFDSVEKPRVCVVAGVCDEGEVLPFNNRKTRKVSRN